MTPVSHLYSLESIESIVLVECHRVLEECGGFCKVLDGDGDGDRLGHTISLQVDILLTACPQQVWSQQGEPGRKYHNMRKSKHSLTG